MVPPPALIDAKQHAGLVALPGRWYLEPVAKRLGSLIVAVAVALVAPACSRGEADAGGAVVPRATTTSQPETTTTTSADPYAIPAVIDADYVNRVLAEFSRIEGDLFRKYVSTRLFEERDLVPIRAMYADAEVRRQAESFAKTRILPAAEYRDPIGDKLVLVESILAAGPECVSVKATFDFSPIRTNPPPVSPGWISLRPKPEGIDPLKLNPTPWVIASDSLTEENRCAG